MDEDEFEARYANIKKEVMEALAPIAEKYRVNTEAISLEAMVQDVAEHFHEWELP